MKANIVATAALIAIAAPLAAHAQAYPVKPVRFIIPYPPGGATDIFGRMLGAKLTAALGQPFVMDQRAGAAGVIGAEAAAKAPPDGYTVFVGQASNLAINQHLMGKLPYDPMRDFTPITLIAGSPNLLVVHPSLPVRTVKDLVALAKSKPGVMNYSSSGSGSPGHLAAEFFKRTARVDMVHVPYKGANPALIAVLSGQASLYFTSPIAAQSFVQTGRLRQIAVTSAQRFPPLPNVPTLAESGYPEIDLTSWWGLLGPAGLSKDIVTRLNAETVKALNTPETKAQLASQGAVVMTNTPEQFAAYIKSEIGKWGRIVKESGARLD